MHNLIVSNTERYDDGNYPEDATYDLSMFVVPVASLNMDDVVHRAAEDVRAKLGLSAQHRKAIADWITKASNGDVLLLPMAIIHGDGIQPDDISIVLTCATEPVVSRLDIRKVERVETEIVAVVKPLMVGKKKVSKKKKKKK